MQQRRIGLELRALNNLLKRRAESSEAHSDVHRLTGTHGYVLGYLAHHPDTDIYQRDIEERFSIRPSTASIILQQMEQNGLLVRESAPHDARRKRLVLTDKAWALHERVEAEHAATEELLRQGLTEEDLAAFFRVADTIKDTLERRNTV